MGEVLYGFSGAKGESRSVADIFVQYDNILGWRVTLAVED